MKKLVLSVILIMPVVVFAENPIGIDQQQMQAMMEKAQEMQACMNNVDKAEMKELEIRGRQLEAEVKQLCALGKRSEAQNKAIAFTKEFASSASMKEIQKCGEMAKEIMSGFPKVTQSTEKSVSEGHICDNLLR